MGKTQKKENGVSSAGPEVALLGRTESMGEPMHEADCLAKCRHFISSSAGFLGQLSSVSPCNQLLVINCE